MLETSRRAPAGSAALFHLQAAVRLDVGPSLQTFMFRRDFLSIIRAAFVGSWIKLRTKPVSPPSPPGLLFTFELDALSPNQTVNLAYTFFFDET